MGSGNDQRIRKGDRGFLLRLAAVVGVSVLLTALVVGILDDSRLGSCAARGFLQLTDTPSSD